MADEFTDLIDLAAERLGGAVIWANDDFFAEKENLLKAQAPVFIDGKYTDRGKWMDGWESRRRRIPGHDEAIVRLGMPGVIRGVVIDTAHFKGNYPDHASLEGCSVDGQPDPAALLSDATTWTEILPKSKLQGDSKNAFAIDRAISQRFTHLRFHIYPDGGVARLRVHGDVVPALRWMGKSSAEVDLAAAENGGLVLACNDMFFGSRHNLVMPGRSVNMGDGWETKRSRREGPDWVVVRLAAEGVIEHVEMDTNHFKGNFPESAALHGIRSSAGASIDELLADESKWTELLPRTKLQAHTRHFYEKELLAKGPYTHVRMRIWPDGGVSRLRLHGVVTRAGREAQALRSLEVAPRAEAERLLASFCGSSAWVKTLADARPFRDLPAFETAVEKAFAALKKDDWLEAFRAHPRIGASKAESGATHANDASKAWSAGEQSKVAAASQVTLDALAETNRAYLEKFAHIYIVCATGKSAEEMLAIAQERLGSDAVTELGRASEEQKKITRLRIEKWVHPT
ncbi:MAG: Allantoicase [Myxococcaceae bacterium]|nr:Allantoicase [Myxococcaceae bacterium]